VANTPARFVGRAPIQSAFHLAYHDPPAELASLTHAALPTQSGLAIMLRAAAAWPVNGYDRYGLPKPPGGGPGWPAIRARLGEIFNQYEAAYRARGFEWPMSWKEHWTGYQSILQARMDVWTSLLGSPGAPPPLVAEFAGNSYPGPRSTFEEAIGRWWPEFLDQ